LHGLGSLEEKQWAAKSAMRIYFTMLGFVLVICVTGCKSPSPQASFSPVHITPEQFSGHQFSLVSNKQVEWYSFNSNGVSATTYGRKHGPKAALLFYWQIGDGDTLVIRDSQNGTASIRQSYQFVVLTNSIAITLDGKRFEIK
jgi:hypothetical protein